MKHLLTIIIAVTLFFPDSPAAQLRRPVVAGQFYSGKPAELRSTIERYLSTVPANQNISGELVALIVPHAGYIYSGQTAAYAYKLLQGKSYETIIIIGVSHHYGFTGASVWKSGEYETPLGKVNINSEIAAGLTDASPLIDFVRRAHTGEHSVEVQVPFLQIVQPGIPIVPIVVGDRNPESIHVLAKALADAAKSKKILLVASSDLAHYVSRQEAAKMDKIGIDCIINLDYNNFIKNLNSGRTQFCGGNAVAAVIEAASLIGANDGRQLHYYDSGYTTGDASSVVSYLSVAITKSKSKPRKGSAMKNKEKVFSLDENQKKTLLEIARNAIVNAVKSGEKPLPSDVTDPVLITECGAFVTINKNDQLRGCIGFTEAFKPLYQTVHECAISAALHDPRFRPLEKSELDEIHLEISVLSPLEKVSDIDDIEVGRDGLMIVKGPYRGLLLPQVAIEYGWDRTTFLKQTCYKAGLPPDAYKDKETVIYSFTAEIFGE